MEPCNGSGGRREERLQSEWWATGAGRKQGAALLQPPGNLCLDVYSSRFLWSLLRASVIPLQPESRVCAGTIPSRG